MKRKHFETVQDSLDIENYKLKFVTDWAFLKKEDLSVNDLVGHMLSRNKTQSGNLPQTRVVYNTPEGELLGKVQIIGESRSIEDMYLLCKYYLPQTSIFDILDVLKQFHSEGNLAMWFCEDHEKFMFDYRYYKCSMYNSDQDIVMHGFTKYKKELT